MSGNQDSVLFEKRGPIAVVTLSNPGRRNALTAHIDHELTRLLSECDADDSVRAVVVTGAGDVFSVGADLESDEEIVSDEENRSAARKEHLEPWDVRKPIIAAINGHAVGGALTMIMNYDLRIAAEDAKLGFPMVQRGLTSEHIAGWLLPRLIGGANTLDLLLTGRIFTGAEAVELGLVKEALPREKVLDRALEIAESIAVNCPPVAVAVTKRLIWKGMGIADIADYRQAENRVQFHLSLNKDTAEAMQAFLERRPGQWTLSPVKDYPDMDV